MKEILVQITLAFLCAVLLADSQGFSVHAQKGDLSKRLSGNTKIDRFNKLPSLPIFFEENRGQIRSDVRFFAHGRNSDFYLTQAGAIFSFPTLKRKQRNVDNSITMNFEGAEPGSVVSGIDEIKTITNYFIGNDPSKWIKGVRTFGGIRVSGLYPGIDAIFYSSEANIQYDFKVAPGADPSLIALRFKGATRLKIDKNGDLVVKSWAGELRHRKPIAYQLIDGEKRYVQANFVLLKKKILAFRIGDYDPARELIIDPLIYSTYLGGSLNDYTEDVALDSAGNIYLASFVNSNNFLQQTPSDNILHQDVRVTKLDSSGTVIIYNTLISGSASEVPEGIDVDSNGNAYVAGITYSPNFPLLNERQGTDQTSTTTGGSDGFITKLAPNGDVAYSTYHGSVLDPDDFIKDLKVDSAGNAYVVGQTAGDDFPLMNAFQTTLAGPTDAFLSRLTASGSLAYSTLLGGSSCGEGAGDVDVDSFGKAYVSGSACGVQNDFPLRNPYLTSGIGFVAKFDTALAGDSSLIYSTKITDNVFAIALGPFGTAYLSEFSFFSNRITKLNASGNGIDWRTASSPGVVNDIAVDSDGNAYVAEQQEFFFADSAKGIKIKKISASGSVMGSTKLNGSLDRDRPEGIAFGGGYVHVVGSTSSSDFPITPNAIQLQNRSVDPANQSQGFLVKLVVGDPNPLIFVPGVAGSSLFEADASGNPIPTEELWPAGAVSLFATKLEKLSLDPSDPQTNVVAVDAIRSVPIVGSLGPSVYEPLLDHIKEEWRYVEYETGMNPKKRNTQCDGQYTGPKPTLFVFAYDWRKSSSEAAEQLAQFVNCVRLFHPDKDIDIVAHSMGSLVARRYLLDHPSNHHFSRVATIGAPFLGAPKAINALITGQFIGDTIAGLDLYYHKKVIKRVMGYSPGPHQLLPSDWYFDLGGRPFGIHNAFLGGFTDSTYSETMTAINSRFPAFPYNTAAQFHDYQLSTQDDWHTDSSGVKYLHLYGEQLAQKTPVKVIAAPFFDYPMYPQGLLVDPDIIRGRGDQTVPVLSAKRSPGLLAPNTILKRCSTSSNSQVEHTGLTKQLFIWDELQAFLDDSTANTSQCQLESSSLAELVNTVPFTEVEVHGVERVDISDEFGNTNTPVGYDTDRAVAGIEYEPGSLRQDNFTDPHRVFFDTGKKVDIKFVTTALTKRLKIETGTSQDAVSTSIKYLDLQLPVNVTAWLKFTENGVENLRYDADSDGTFETEVQPTFSLTGGAANDSTAPTINVTSAVDNGVTTITINANDANSGINQVRYVFHGETTDHVYSGPFTASPTQSSLLYVSAEDNAGNRGVMLKWLDTAPPVSSTSQTPPSNASGWNTSDVTFELKALDEVGGSGVDTFTYSASGAHSFAAETLARPVPPFTFPSPSTSSDFIVKTLTIFKEGITTFTFYAKDRAGNVETIKTHQVKVDKSLPISSHTSSSDGSQTTFAVTSTDSVSGVSEILYAIDGGPQQTYTAPFVVSNTGGHVVSYFARDLAGNEETPRTVFLNPGLVPKSVLISEFRTRGHLGADDEFIELYNNGDTSVDISGWSLSLKHGSVSTPIALATINGGVVLPPRGHYLLRKDGTTNYSLGGYAEADQMYTGSLGDNCGIKLVSSAGTTIDAVGFASVTDATYREGTGITPSAGISTNGQYSFARSLLKNLPVDSNNNKPDFAFVATDGGTYNNLKAVLGSPGPENLSSMTYREGDILITQIDPNVTLAEAPNRLFDYTNPPPQYPVGMLSIRRKLTNNSGTTITQLKLRITTITTKNSAVIFPQQAQLRTINSSDISVTSADGQTSIPLRGLSIETVPTTVEAGLNSSLTLDLGSGLNPGQSLNINLKAGIVVNGQYKLEFRVEAVKVIP